MHKRGLSYFPIINVGKCKPQNTSYGSVPSNGKFKPTYLETDNFLYIEVDEVSCQTNLNDVSISRAVNNGFNIF